MSGGGADEGGRTWSRRRRPYTVTVGAPARPTTTSSWRRWCRPSRASTSSSLGWAASALYRGAVPGGRVGRGDLGRLDLLVGVTRVIVGDMALQGVVVLYRPQATVADADLPPVELLERVLHGLKNIS